MLNSWNVAAESMLPKVSFRSISKADEERKIGLKLCFSLSCENIVSHKAIKCPFKVHSRKFSRAISKSAWDGVSSRQKEQMLANQAASGWNLTTHWSEKHQSAAERGESLFLSTTAWKIRTRCLKMTVVNLLMCRHAAHLRFQLWKKKNSQNIQVWMLPISHQRCNKKQQFNFQSYLSYWV